jgi:hypothetical protein
LDRHKQPISGEIAAPISKKRIPFTVWVFAALVTFASLMSSLTRVLARQDRFVQSLDALKEQMASCTHMANKELSASEAQDLLKYLNDQFYRFR